MSVYTNVPRFPWVTPPIPTVEVERRPIDPDVLANAVAERVVERLTAPLNDIPLFVDYSEAARLLSCSVAALKHRKSRGQIPARFVLETGRRVQFRRALLAELKTCFRGRTQ